MLCKGRGGGSPFTLQAYGREVRGANTSHQPVMTLVEAPPASHQSAISEGALVLQGTGNGSAIKAAGNRVDS
jgi:hypothetical protein